MSSADAAVDVDAERVERVRELDAAAADLRMIRRRSSVTVGVGGDRRAGLGRPAGRRRGPGRPGSARARARATRARPRSTSSVSSRDLTACFINSDAADDPLRAIGRQLVRCEPPSARRSAASAARASTHSAASAPRRVEAVERRIGRLAGGRVLAGGLAELRRRAFDVEDVVDDLEGEAELGGVASIASSCVVGRAGHDRAGRAPTRGSARRSCARASRAAPSASSGAARRRLAAPRDRSPVRRPCRPRPRPRRRSPIDARACARRCVGVVAAARLARQQRERFGQQRRRRRGSPCPRRTRRAASAGRAAACRCPSPAGRRGSSE